MKYRKVLLLILISFTLISIINVDAKTLCKRAKTLQNEVCSSNYSEYFCSGNGYKTGDNITYGSLGKNDTLSIGDAFDCDVNGDEVFNSRERFYYLGESNNKNALFIYYSNVLDGEPYIDKTVAYNVDNQILSGPKTAISWLPTTTQWKNVSITPKKRNIYDETKQIKVADFDYTGYAARLLTLDEVKNACGDATIKKKGSLNSCNFLLAYTAFSKNNDDLLQGAYNYGFWLEDAFSSSNNSALAINAMYSSISPLGVNKLGLGVRPVIEVAKDEIELVDANVDVKNDIKDESVNVDDTGIYNSKLCFVLGVTILLVGIGIILLNLIKKPSKINR